MSSIPTRHPQLLAWVSEMVALCKPESVRTCDGSEAENTELIAAMLKSGTLLRLNPQKRPNSYLSRSDRRDVARRVPHLHLLAEPE